jgi:hypothetical protein
MESVEGIRDDVALLQKRVDGEVQTLKNEVKMFKNMVKELEEENGKLKQNYTNLKSRVELVESLISKSINFTLLSNTDPINSPVGTPVITPNSVSQKNVGTTPSSPSGHLSVGNTKQYESDTPLRKNEKDYYNTIPKTYESTFTSTNPSHSKKRSYSSISHLETPKKTTDLSYLPPLSSPPHHNSSPRIVETLPSSMSDKYTSESSYTSSESQNQQRELGIAVGLNRNKRNLILEEDSDFNKDGNKYSGNNRNENSSKLVKKHIDYEDGNNNNNNNEMQILKNDSKDILPTLPSSSFTSKDNRFFIIPPLTSVVGDSIKFSYDDKFHTVVFQPKVTHVFFCCCFYY